jgi:hypothetical protein
MMQQLNTDSKKPVYIDNPPLPTLTKGNELQFLMLCKHKHLLLQIL